MKAKAAGASASWARNISTARPDPLARSFGTTACNRAARLARSAAIGTACPAPHTTALWHASRSASPRSRRFARLHGQGQKRQQQMALAPRRRQGCICQDQRNRPRRAAGPSAPPRSRAAALSTGVPPEASRHAPILSAATPSSARPSCATETGRAAACDHCRRITPAGPGIPRARQVGHIAQTGLVLAPTRHRNAVLRRHQRQSVPQKSCGTHPAPGPAADAPAQRRSERRLIKGFRGGSRDPTRKRRDEDRSPAWTGCAFPMSPE